MDNTILIAILSGSAVAAAISSATSIYLWHLNNKKKQDNRDDDIAAGVQLLLYDRIKFLGLNHITKGRIASDDLEDLKRMHKIYHDKLHGNGYLDHIMHKVDKLPIDNG